MSNLFNHIICPFPTTPSTMPAKAVKRPGKLQSGKGGKKKKTTLRFTVDCTHPVEDGIMDVTNFVSTLILLVTCKAISLPFLWFLYMGF